MSRLKIVQIRSAIGRQKVQKVTIRTLGIHRLHEAVVHDDTPQIRGMIAKVRHLLRVEEVD
ncbi:MAG: 50S ribosomal protein L30 [Candidatus Eisenbacteria bacterium]|nr:50S ribosomal protein L30 [Candidatus Eisenbacteria bacterium]